MLMENVSARLALDFILCHQVQYVFARAVASVADDRKIHSLSMNKKCVMQARPLHATIHLGLGSIDFELRLSNAFELHGVASSSDMYRTS